MFFIFSLYLCFCLITEDALILRENENCDAVLFVLNPDNTTLDSSETSSQRDMNITNAENKSTCVKVSVCREQENIHGSEMLWKDLLSNRGHSATRDSKENLPPPHSLKTCPTPSLGNLHTSTNLHLDTSSSLSPVPLNALKSQAEPMNPPCGQAAESPTEIMSVGKESQKQINHSEEKPAPRLSCRLSSDLLKAPDASLVAPETNVENTACGKSVTQSNTAMLAPTPDGPNAVDPGVVFFR